MINIIIDLINGGLDGIADEQIVLGLTQRVYRAADAESIDFMPGVVKQDGEAVYAGVDDIASLIIYHKSNTANLAFSARGGYGDSRQNEDTLACSIIAAWDTRKLPIQAVDMLLLIRSRLPQAIADIPGIKDVTITPSSAILNTKQVFDTEYSIGASGYLLPLYINFIQLNYNILIRYDQQCIEKCINCTN
jgi:hypothetical protein